MSAVAAENLRRAHVGVAGSQCSGAIMPIGSHPALIAAAAMLDAIDALHVRWDDCPWEEPEPLCRDCMAVWPCNTHRILHPSTPTEDQ